MIKDLVVALSGRGARDAAGDYAVSVAEAFDAHLAGIAFAYEPVIPGTVMGGVPSEFIEASRAKSRAEAQAGVGRFEQAARRSSLSIETRICDASVVAAAEVFGRIARRFDLSLVAQADPDQEGGQDLLIEAALFQSGRPAIVVPYIQKSGLSLDRVLVCWDGSRTAARAIGDAMPFLERAKAVEIVIVATARAERDEITGAAVGRHLARHSLDVEVKRIVADDIKVADTILSHAADCAADFIVMGGYGHSRLREFILGGATRGILESMTVPVLMSH